VLTGQTLGKGQYGIVSFAHSRDDPSDVYAVKVIERKRVHGQKAMQNLQNEIAIMAEIRS
jgi:serine/threonine protein kinase